MTGQKVNILVYTAMYNRPRVSALFATAIKRFAKEAPKGVNVSVFATVTGNDCVQVCKKNRFAYLEHENKPLGRKWNAGMQQCVESIDFDYVLIMGDDDIISSKAWPMIMEQIAAGTPYFGFQSIYFVNSEKPQAARFTYRGKSADNKLMGCGRFISKKALIDAGYKTEIKFLADFEHGLMRYTKDDTVLVFSHYADYLVKCGHAVYTATQKVYRLWRDGQDSGLDHESETNLIHNGYIPVAIETKTPLMADIKSSQNIWAYSTRASKGVRAPYVEAIAMLSEKELKQLTELAK